MADIIFIDPMGDDHKNPDPDWLKELIFNRGDDFWDVGSQDAALDFDERDYPKAHVHLKGLEDSFMIKHKYRGDNERLHSLRFGEHAGETVEASIGGQPQLYYREYFVPKEVAWEAVDYFLRTGDRKPDLRWEIAQYPAELY